MEEIILETHQLGYGYSRNSQEIKKISLQVPKGSVYGFIGPNGSGKSTTIRLILGLLTPQHGEVKLFDKNMPKERISVLGKLGALIENPSLYSHLNAIDHLKLTARYKNLRYTNSKLEEILDWVNLRNQKSKKTNAYSMGMKQRLGVAMSLVGNPELLILDEPINGLDPMGIIEMRELIKNLNSKTGVTVFISSHILSEIEKVCTHIGVLSAGQLVFQGSLDEFKRITQSNLTFDLETSDYERSIKTLEGYDLLVNNTYSSTISVKLRNKSELSFIIDKLREEKIEIYQIVSKNDMESLFIQVTKN